MKLSKNEIDFLKKFFSSKPVKRAYVFGSYSRNDSDANSDLDLMVELDYSKHIGLSFIKMKYELEDALHKNIDLISDQGVSPHILPFINRDKQLIYER